MTFDDSIKRRYIALACRTSTTTTGMGRTRQTADTFDAAATFFDLTREWGTPDPETLQKIKFAKWNAARILKAIREGKDPNESNPKPVEPGPETPLDPNDPDVQQLSGSAARPVSVEDAPDAGEPSGLYLVYW
ncbi:Vta1 like-domain-containing protein [Ilyonectria destructans]|nr:Vta1 like-domain-containing protein [Ilyonectria destructans]